MRSIFTDVFILLLTLFSFSGCSVHQSHMDQALLDLPERFAEQADFANTSATEGAYWKRFNDPVLNELIAEGLKNNLDIVIQRSKIDQLESIEKQSHSSLFPTISIKGNLSEEQQLTSLGESEGNTVRLSIAAGYEVDLWKKISNRQNFAFLNLLASKTDMQTLFVSISAHISDLYFSLIEQKAQLELIDRIIRLNENNLELIENRYKEGLTSSLDVYMARQNILAIKSKKPQYEKLLATTSHALAVLIGRFPEKEISNAGTILPIPSFDYATGIPSDLVKHRPDIQASLLRLEAQDKLVASAAADRFPSLNIMGAIGTGRIDFTNVISGTFWNLLLDIVAPVFDGGRRAAEVERNEALFMELLANYHKTVLRAFQEVEDGLIQNNTTRQWLSIVTQKLSASEATLRVAHDNYNMGLTDYLNVLISQTAYFEAESQLISAKRQLISDWIGLRRALGLRIEKES